MKKTIFLSVAFAAVFASCNRQPTADFDTDLSEYYAGETIHTTNKSLDAESYKWTLPDGQTSASKDVDYYLPDNFAAGVYTIELEAISKNGKKRSTAKKSFTVY
ncbi:MAG: hypothetical protein K0R26_806 [Bacteroidota bacterium]|jgi:PKD repeat protein|nr:hypothetical protein [Bacteroidota bacterium]